MKEYLFSYGTLQNVETQLAVFGRILDGTNDILSDFKLSPVEIKDPAFISKGETRIQLTAIPVPGNFIEGMVFEVSNVELLESDKYKPDNFRRIKVLLQSGKEAWIYLVSENA